MSLDATAWAAGLWQIMTLQMVYATLIFGVAWAIAWHRSRRSPTLLYAVWGLVVLRLILPVDLASPVSLTTALNHLAAQFAAGPAQLETAASSMTVPTAAHLDNLTPAGDSSSLLPTLLLIVWAAGSLLFAVRTLRRRRPYRRLARNAPEVSEPVALHLLHRWRGRYGIRRPVRLVSEPAAGPSDEPTPLPAVGPFTVGTLRPTIFVPASFVRRPQLLEVTLAHELAHVSRFDDLRLCFQEAVRALWVGFPLVHLATAAMRRERELICDQLAISHGKWSRVRYLATLQTLLREGLTPAVAVPGLGSGHLGASLNRRKRKSTVRFDPLLSESRPGSRSGRLFYSALLVFLLPMAPMAPTANAEAPTADPPAAPATSTQNPLSKMINPLPGEKLTSGFGPRKNPFNGKTMHHDGVDLHSEPSSEILAPADGVVELATEAWEGNEDWGTVLILDHGSGIKTRYAHLESLSVKPGDHIEQGQVVGVPGNTGKSTGRHLHFEIWQGDQLLDPASIIPGW